MNRDRWIDLIAKHNPKEDDLCDLLEEAYQMGVEDGKEQGNELQRRMP